MSAPFTWTRQPGRPAQWTLTAGGELVGACRQGANGSWRASLWPQGLVVPGRTAKGARLALQRSLPRGTPFTIQKRFDIELVLKRNFQSPISVSDALETTHDRPSPSSMAG